MEAECLWTAEWCDQPNSMITQCLTHEARPQRTSRHDGDGDFCNSTMREISWNDLVRIADGKD